MKIRLSKQEDVNTILSLIKKSIKYMNNQKIYQWDDLYPNHEILTQDIINKSLFVIENEKDIVGIIVLNEHQEPEYNDISWKYKSSNVLVVHRLCIDPNSQGKGIANKLMDFAEQYAQDNKYTSIRLDAFKENKIAVSLYEKRDYETSGTVTFRKGPFYCFEKRILINF